MEYRFAQNFLLELNLLELNLLEQNLKEFFVLLPVFVQLFLEFLRIFLSF